MPARSWIAAAALARRDVVLIREPDSGSIQSMRGRGSGSRGLDLLKAGIPHFASWLIDISAMESVELARSSSI